MKRHPAIRRSISRASVVMLLGSTGAAIFATAAGFAGCLWWGFDLCSHFRAQFAIVLILPLVFLALSKRWIMGSFALLAVLVNANEVGRLYLARASAAAHSQAALLRLFHLNAWHVRNRDPEMLLRHLESSDADIVLIQESSAKIIAELESLAPRYRIVERPVATRPHRSVILVNTQCQPTIELIGVHDIAVTLPGEQVVDLGTAVQLKFAEQVISLLSPHISAPGSGGRGAVRRLEFAALIDWVRQNPANAIVIGDLNCTPWSCHFRSLVSQSGLVNSQQGFGFQGTWPLRPPDWLTWIFTIPIDHCLHSSTFSTVDRRIGPYLGSDHLPLIVTLRIPRDAASMPGPSAPSPARP